MVSRTRSEYRSTINNRARSINSRLLDQQEKHNKWVSIKQTNSKHNLKRQFQRYVTSVEAHVQRKARHLGLWFHHFSRKRPRRRQCSIRHGCRDRSRPERRCKLALLALTSSVRPSAFDAGNETIHRVAGTLLHVVLLGLRLHIIDSIVFV